MSALRGAAVAAVMVLGLATAASAEVLKVEVTRRTEVAGGKAFGAAGAYELVEGRILFGFDPASRYNGRIVDLALAPRVDGKVQAWADFAALRPKRVQPDATLLLDVSNRGLKYLLQVLDFGGMAARPVAESDLGDAMLLRMGLTLLWVGWQADVPASDTARVGLEVPEVKGPGGETITGLVRSDWVVPRAVKSLALAHGQHDTYLPADLGSTEDVLTVRDGRYAPRQVVPRGSWRYGREADGGYVPDSTAIYLESGFEAGKIYELVYRAKNPRLIGLGLAAVRDAMSHAKYDPASPFAAKHVVAFGISQTGRFLRHYLWQGFNTDERGRKVIDGMMIHVAGGGRGSFNHRFAQPSRDAHRFDAFFFPTDLFPFTSATTTDPVTGETDGLNAHMFAPANLPKVFQTNSGYEYWGRAASLIHTTPDGKRDVAPPANERLYLLAGGQHVPGAFPPPPANRHPGSRAYRGDPLDYRLPLRALTVAMVEWVRDGKAPPASAYPKLADGGLVPIDRLALPAVPDLGRPAVIHEPDRLDFGPRWKDGIDEREPPVLGERYPTRVPQVDSLGNEQGGFRTVELEAPLASYLTWNLRRGQPGDTGELTRILGTYLALPRTEAERRESRDPRPSIAALYPSREAYLAKARTATRSLVRRRMLLEHDVDRALERAAAHWDWLERNP